MARGGINVYVQSAANPTNLNEYGTRNRAEEVAANKSLQSGGDVNESIARLANAGGGTLRVRPEQVGRILATTQLGVLQARDGTIIVQDSRFGGKRDAVSIIKPNGEVEEAKNAQVTVGPNGVETLKFGSGSTYVVQRTRVDVTRDQKSGLLTINLPPNLRGAAFDKQGNMNGWKINPKAITDKEVRAWAYRNLSKDGTLKFPADSPVAAKVNALLSKAGYARVPVGEINRIFQETSDARYVKGTIAGLRGAFGAQQRIEAQRQSEAQG